MRFAVTPYAGVWIEIKKKSKIDTKIESLPTRECGLKSMLKEQLQANPESLPTRECGLKYYMRVFPQLLTGHSLRGSVD